MRRYLGIDPGVTGAYTVLEVDMYGNQRVVIHETPVLWTTVGSGKRRRYNVTVLWAQLSTIGPITFAYLEQQTARPNQGVASTFSTGEGYGIWTALLTAAAIPYAVVAAPRWRSRVGLAALPAGTDKKIVKEGVRLAVCRRFPALILKLDHADSVMMAVAAALEHGVVDREPQHG